MKKACREGVLVRFMLESNRIEGIGHTTGEELRAFEALLKLPKVRVADLYNFVNVCAGPTARLRLAFGDDVQVGDHVPPPGGQAIIGKLHSLLYRVEHPDLFPGKATPLQIHHDYENLHPFMDGNGRSGRALWAWQMIRQRYPVALDFKALSLGFLHVFYYQTLAAGR